MGGVFDSDALGPPQLLASTRPQRLGTRAPGCPPTCLLLLHGHPAPGCPPCPVIPTDHTPSLGTHKTPASPSGAHCWKAVRGCPGGPHPRVPMASWRSTERGRSVTKGHLRRHSPGHRPRSPSWRTLRHSPHVAEGHACPGWEVATLLPGHPLRLGPTLPCLLIPSEDVFPCKDCGIWYRSERNLQAHLLYYCASRQGAGSPAVATPDEKPKETYPNERVCPFPQCRKSCPSASSLEIHMRSHSGEHHPHPPTVSSHPGSPCLSWGCMPATGVPGWSSLPFPAASHGPQGPGRQSRGVSGQ